MDTTHTAAAESDHRLAVNPAEAARLASVSRGFIYVLMNEGRLASIKLGKRRLIRVADLRALLDEAPADG